MAGERILVLQTNGRKKRGPTLDSLSGGVDEDFSVVTPVTFVTPVATVNATGKIDVWVNGLMQREGATHDFTRNTSLNRIVFNYTVPQNAWVRVRIF